MARVVSNAQRLTEGTTAFRGGTSAGPSPSRPSSPQVLGGRVVERVPSVEYHTGWWAGPRAGAGSVREACSWARYRFSFHDSRALLGSLLGPRNPHRVLLPPSLYLLLHHRRHPHPPYHGCCPSFGREAPRPTRAQWQRYASGKRNPSLSGTTTALCFSPSTKNTTFSPSLSPSPDRTAFGRCISPFSETVATTGTSLAFKVDHGSIATFQANETSVSTELCSTFKCWKRYPD